MEVGEPVRWKYAERRQHELAPKEDLRPHVGQWVALREGRVVAKADDPADLYRRREVRREDVIAFVEDPDASCFF
jgi:hypothetical protein